MEEDFAVSVPTSVTNLLDLQNVKYNIAHLALNNFEWGTTHSFPSQAQATVQSTLLKDGIGKVQILYPSHCLLDLNSLNKTLSRQLRVTSPEDLKHYYSEYKIDSVPGLPNHGGFPTVIDERLLAYDTLLLNSGSAGHALQIDQLDFQLITREATRLDFAVPLNTLSEPIVKDYSQKENEEQIKHAIENFTTLRIKQRLEETLELPPLPVTAQKIINLRADPNADINDLAKIVETDPSLAAQVVSWAGSPYYAAPGKIKSIQDAIVRVLGFDMVLNLSLGLSLGKTMKLPSESPECIANYWQKAVYTAAAVEALVTSIPRDHRPSFGMSYLSGLLNNFGFIVLAEIFPPHFEMINHYIAANPNVPISMIERHLIGITREQLASCLMGIWQMPEEVQIALRYQRIPEYYGEHHELSKLLFLAHSHLHARFIEDGPDIDVPDDVYESLHIDKEQANIRINTMMESSSDLDIIVKQMS
ncbi:MAG: HDOD domain-containing protein [Cellvibrionaceae bacterium]